MLNVVIGLVFVMLLFSLLATTIMELLAGWMSLRGKNLKKALRSMLTDQNDQKTFEKFKQNALYQQLAGKSLGKKTPPSYLSSRAFRSILMDTIFEGKAEDGNETERFQVVENTQLRKVLQQLHRDSHGDDAHFKFKVESWYDDVMDRSTGWYKRNTQYILLAIGLVIAVLFNADTISIYDKLSKDPTARLELMTSAQQFMNTNNSVAPNNTQSFQQFQGQMNQLVNQDLASIQNPLGLGWENMAINPDYKVYSWFEKILGWLVTALAVSLGANFWFDLLRKMVNIRSSGQAPKRAEDYEDMLEKAKTIPTSSNNNHNTSRIEISKPVG